MKINIEFGEEDFKKLFKLAEKVVTKLKKKGVKIST